MRLGFVRLLAYAWLSSGPVLCGCSNERPANALTVAAASSLRHTLESSAAAFEAKHPGIELALSFAASSTHARQISAGASFDVFISADRVNLERVAEFLELRTQSVILTNRLALVVREGLTTAVESPADLGRARGPIAIAGPEVPSGRYAREYLRAAGLEDELRSRFVTGRNAAATLALVEAGVADFGFVYLTDHIASRASRRVWVSDAEGLPRIEYVAAALAGTPASAADFVHWLAGDSFQAAASAAGFRGGPE